MIKPRWRKVLKDLSANKTRSLLVILSITIGVFAVGTIIGTQILLNRELDASYASVSPASAVLITDPFDENIVETIRRIDSIADVEARRIVRVRLQVGPDQWTNLSLNVIPNFSNIRLNKIIPVSGAWPPPRRGLLLERTALPLTQAGVGGVLIVETVGNRQRELTLDGLVHDLTLPAAQFVGEPVGYITMETLEWLGYPAYFDQLNILVANNTTDKAYIQQVTENVRDQLEKSGHTVYGINVPEPGEHPIQALVDSLSIILGALGALSLFASGFLVINIINSLLAQHTQQIGIMKAIGARRGQIMWMYMSLVALFGLLAFIIAVPISILAVRLLSGFLADLLNFDLGPAYLPLHALLIQFGIAILVPALAGLYPILRGTRITVREAMAEYGLGKGEFGTHLVDRVFEKVTSTLLTFSRPLRISLRNTIRRKGRLALTLLTLTLSGAIFIATLSVQASLRATLADALAYFNYDVEVIFERDYRTEEIGREILQVPGVAAVGSWLYTSARRIQPNGFEGDSLDMLGIQWDTKTIRPTLLAGRWLLPEDGRALVINSQVLQIEPDLAIGDTINLRINGRDTKWQIVGLVQAVMTGPLAYANQDTLAPLLGLVGRSQSAQVIAEQHNSAFQINLARRLKDHLDRAGLRVSVTNTIATITTTIENQFNIVVILLAVMATLLAGVGGLGLMGTMSINVLERTREIGVMRAVGASNKAVLRIVLAEGIFVGSISWLLAAIFAIPIGRLLSNSVGIALIGSPLNFTFAFGGTFSWLMVMMIISAAASYLPARNAARLSVRETLVYE
jgi:putative ABC transport system permease protein